MDDLKIYKKLSIIFEDVFDENDLEIGPETTANDIEEWDSLNHIRMLIETEVQFGIKFTSAEVGSLKDVSALLQLIKSKL